MRSDGVRLRVSLGKIVAAKSVDCCAIMAGCGAPDPSGALVDQGAQALRTPLAVSAEVSAWVPQFALKLKLEGLGLGFGPPARAC